VDKIKYEIVPIEKKYLEGVAKLRKIGFANRNSIEEEMVQLKHLYIENPFTKNFPTSLVALYNNKVVGFRGLIGLPFSLNYRKINVLIPSSATTHPDFRRQGLFSTMNTKSFEIYKDQYQVFLNTSSNKLSTPGYIKLGWQVLGEKDYLYKLALLKNKKLKKGYETIFHASISINDIMTVSENSIFNNDSIHIFKGDEKLTQWLFKLSGYKFCSLKKDNKLIAYCYYLVKNKTCIIADFDSVEPQNSLSYLTNSIAKKHKVSFFNFFTAKNNSKLYKIISSSNFFSTNNCIRNKILNKPLTPFLIRPAKLSFNENDFMIDNTDVRNVDNWNINRLFNY
jgi:hypothetical protein